MVKKLLKHNAPKTAEELYVQVRNIILVAIGGALTAILIFTGKTLVNYYVFKSEITYTLKEQDNRIRQLEIRLSINRGDEENANEKKYIIKVPFYNYNSGSCK